MGDHHAVCLSFNFKFLTDRVLFTKHGINAMTLEANPAISPFLMICNNKVNTKCMTEVSLSAVHIISNKKVNTKLMTEVQLVYPNYVIMTDP
jgi:hypothetical protein